MGAGWKGLPVLYQRCYISVMGWGGEGITGAMEVETHPPLRPANVPFCSKSFFILCFFFFFSHGWGLVNFLKVLFNVGERAPAPDRVTCSPPSLHPPRRRLAPPQASLLSLPRPLPPLKPCQLHPILTASLVVCSAFSLTGFQSTVSQSTKQFFPLGVGGNKRLCTYFVCV